VDIRLHCERCGKPIRAPREMAGKRAPCPACGHSVYIPMPEGEIEELPLAPEDTDVLRNEAALQAERRRLDSLLAREDKPAEGDDDPAGGRGSTGSIQASNAGPSGATRTERAVIAYLVAMRNTDLAGAERALLTLKLQPRVAREVVDRLAADQIPPSEMANVPPGVYQGFLKNLRSKLS
jgi:hypothetical protein